MLHKLLRFRRSPFVSNVAVLASGATAAQAIAMGFSPIITRLFGAEAYGVQAVFMSLAGIMATIAAMTYPIAIVLPRSDADAIGIAKLSMYVGVAMSLLVTIILFNFGPSILALLNAEEISAFMYLIPVFMFFSVLVAVLQQWLTRKKAFKLAARVTVWRALLVNVTRLGAGAIAPIAVVLVVINTFSGLLHATLLWLGLRKEPGANPMPLALAGQPSGAWELAKRHGDFPLLRSPQVLMNAASQALPVFLLASFFGLEEAGFYSICKMVLSKPTGLVGHAVMQVFYPRFNEAIHKGENARALLIKATLGLAALGLIPYAIVIAFGPVLFKIVFGDEWGTAGEYAQWLAVWLFLAFINRPAVAAIPVLRIQGIFLIYEITSVLLRAGALYVGFALLQDDLLAVCVFSITGAVLNLFLICYVINFSQHVTGGTKRVHKA